MKKSICRISFALAFLLSQAFGLTQITGTIHRADGSRFNGKAVFSLSFAGARDKTCSPNPCPLSSTIFSYPVANGTFPSAAYVVANGDIDPAGTYYQVALLDSFGHFQTQFNVVIPTTIGAFDLGAAQQTSVVTSNVSLVNPANISGNNTFTGINTFSGTVNLNQSTTIGASGSLNFTTGATLNGTIGGNPAFSGDVTLNSGITPTGTGFKHQRGSVGCTTAAVQGDVCTSALITWSGTPFPDANYTLTCSLEDLSGEPVVVNVIRSSGSQFRVAIGALSASASAANFDCIAVHD